MFGLNEEQQKLRETAFNFFQKELAPYAKEIDKQDSFKWVKLETYNVNFTYPCFD